jgi:hypothetical protein
MVPVPESLNHAVFTTYRKSLESFCMNQMVLAVPMQVPVQESLNLVVFTTIERGFWQFLESPRIMVPESLNIAVFTTYRKRALIT